MKPFQKVIAVVLAAIMLISAASCTPISLTKQWSYKYGDDVLTTQQDIGVYIYALYQAYNTAQTYAQDSKKYVEGEPFMDIKITDDEGNKAVAREWILEEAEKIALNIITTDYLVAQHEATYDEATMESAKATAQDTWDLGAYASYGYYSPMSDELEPYGVSFDSFFASSYAADVKQTALFSKIYDKGGEKEVSDEELTEYFKENYVNYSYIPVNMYTDTTDAEGNASTTPNSKKEINKTVKYVEDMADKINAGDIKATKAFDNVAKKYDVTDENIINDQVEPLTDTETNNEDLYKALKDLKVGEAAAVTVDEDGDAPMVYLVVKNDVNDSVEEYVADETNRSSVLSNCKKEEFVDFIEAKTAEIAKSDALTANTTQLDRYAPDMFFVEPEEETEAEAEAEA